MAQFPSQFSSRFRRPRATAVAVAVTTVTAREELRALSRGFAPPILLDRGLAAAPGSLTVRSPIPVRFANELDPQVSLPQEIERNAYFAATELLTNATRHSGASGVELHLALRRVPGPDGTWLDLSFTDDGMSGAQALPGHGLACPVSRRFCL